MMKERIKKINKLVKLIVVRQLWKLADNLYKIITQPFLALKTLVIKEKDKSQMFLVGVVISMPILLYSVARVIWDYYRYGLVIKGVGMFFMIAAGVEIIFLGYVGFWLWKVVKNK